MRPLPDSPVAASLHADRVAAALDGRAAWLVIVAGVVAALHVGKLPPGIPILRAELGLTLVQAGFLLSVMQVAGMLLGALAGLLADRMGLRRTMLLGLCLLALGCALGATASRVSLLLAARMLEGIGLLLAVLPAPGLIRRLVQGPQALSRLLGAWGAYMPTG
ncbi:MAG: MFS transporter, partial [Burkholderiales bacterium]|nr:MFS transporter [Burkholderiales bacterium]